MPLQLGFISASADPLAGGFVTFEQAVPPYTITGPSSSFVVSVDFSTAKTSSFTASANINYVFKQWITGSVTASTNISYSFIIPTGPAGITFVYTASFSGSGGVGGGSSSSISTSVYPVGVGTALVNGLTTGLFVTNTTQSVTASANANYMFLNWKSASAIVSTSPTYTFPLTQNTILTASFFPSTPYRGVAKLTTQLISTQLHPVVIDWYYRILKNTSGSAVISQTSIVAVNNLWKNLAAYGLDKHMKVVVPVIPDNPSPAQTVAMTPLYNSGGIGKDPWYIFNSAGGYMSVQGLSGAPLGYAATGWSGNTAFSSVNNCGVTVYTPYAPESEIMAEFGCAVSANTMVLDLNSSNETVFDCWAQSVPRLQAANSQIYSGFFSGNRISATSCRIDNANSTTPFTTIASQSATSGSLTSDEFYFWNINPVSPNNNRVLSFTAIHDGLSVTDAQNFYNVIQTYRKQIGGGWA